VGSGAVAHGVRSEDVTIGERTIATEGLPR
jgi:hypothetical protein